jgi:2-oxoglutarate ferredoxin oxidoreductase subunit alpha
MHPFFKKYAGKSLFLLGDEAAAHGAVWAGCNFFGGYPITPASEIAETLSVMMPQVGGFCVQMEDEIASLAAVIGAVWSGARGMTATSGPGFSLMQENIGYAIMTETPCVIIDVQRTGPSTGQATKPAQGDIMQARWGTHGDHEMIALAPSSVQECFDFTIECFNLAERFRHPVILLMDGEIGHLRERLTFPADPSKVRLEERQYASEKDFPFGGTEIPPMIKFGTGRFVHVTGSSHKKDGMRDVSTQAVHDELIRRFYSKIESRREEIARVEDRFLEDAEVVVMSYGTSARPSLGAVLRAREKGLKVGFLRFVSIWPFPRHVVKNLNGTVRKILVPEMNLGQLSREIERFVSCEVVSVSKIGGISLTIQEILGPIEKSFSD